MSLYFGYKKVSSNIDTEELEKDISALKTGLATNNTKTKSLETKSTSESTKVSTLETKMSTVETDITNIKSTNSTQNTSIQSNWVKGITNESDITWAKNKANSNASDISSLKTKVDALPKIYTYHFTYFNLRNDWSYPKSGTADENPHFWMYCKGLNSSSIFHVHTFAYDTDSTLEFSYTLTFKLDFYTSAGVHTSKEIFTAQIQDHQIIGQRFFFLGKKFTLSTLTGYQSFAMAKLSVKGSSTKGNEFTVSCSFEI